MRMENKVTTNMKPIETFNCTGQYYTITPSHACRSNLGPFSRAWQSMTDRLPGSYSEVSGSILSTTLVFMIQQTTNLQVKTKSIEC